MMYDVWYMMMFYDEYNVFMMTMYAKKIIIVWLFSSLSFAYYLYL